MIRKIGLAVWAVASGVVLSCSSSPGPDFVARAVATMEPKSGSEVRGIVTFTERESGEVEIRVDLEGVPEGRHGFHVHERGDCSAPDATSAGGHFNPFDAPHAGPGAARHHVGDLGNIDAGSDGVVAITRVSDDLTVTAGEASVVGKAVIVHADADDLTSQPTGAAGGRIACGVITWVN